LRYIIRSYKKEPRILIKIKLEAYYKCYHCVHFSTNDQNEYLTHGAQNHLYKPLFPNQTELERYNLRPQNKTWEKCNITEEEVTDRLAKWVEKRIREEENKTEKRNNV